MFNNLNSIFGFVDCPLSSQLSSYKAYTHVYEPKVLYIQHAIENDL